MKTLRILLLLTCLGSAPAAWGQAALYDLRGQTGDWFCHSAASIGDLNGDGFRDLLVGAPRWSGMTGAVYVYSGRDAANLIALTGENLGDHFGYAVDAVGDLDGDGVEEFVVGAPYHDSGSFSDDGRVYVYSGATLSLLQVHDGGISNAHLGWSVAGLHGNALGSSAWDFAAGAPGAQSSKGLVRTFDGLTGGDISSFGFQTGGQFGYSLDGAGDTDGDGLVEMIVGAPNADSNGWTDNGAAYLTQLGTQLWSMVGTQSKSFMGISVASVGDANGDGLCDFALGESGLDAGFSGDGGRVHLVSGAPGHAVLWFMTGTAGEKLGSAVAAAGDTDGDGFADVLAGAPYADVNGPDRGRAIVLSGTTGATLFTQYGYADGDQMGQTVASLGDINNDGFGDIVVGSPRSNSNGTDSGWAHLALMSAPLPVSYCTAKQNSSGCIPDMGFVGCPSASVGDNLHFQANAVLPQKPGLMIWAFGSAAIPFFGGTLCLAPPIKRTPVQVSTNINGSACGGQFDMPFTQADMSANGLSAGTTMYTQWWYRDPGFAAPNNVGLTDGLAVMILP